MQLVVYNYEDKHALRKKSQYEKNVGLIRLQQL